LDRENEKWLVGIAGIPGTFNFQSCFFFLKCLSEPDLPIGSGKSTTAREVAKRVNQRLKDAVVIVPMDGFHLYRHQLDQFPVYFFS
jgi:hypothetical protein